VGSPINALITEGALVDRSVETTFDALWLDKAYSAAVNALKSRELVIELLRCVSSTPLRATVLRVIPLNVSKHTSKTSRILVVELGGPIEPSAVGGWDLRRWCVEGSLSEDRALRLVVPYLVAPSVLTKRYSLNYSSTALTVLIHIERTSCRGLARLVLSIVCRDGNESVGLGSWSYMVYEREAKIRAYTSIPRSCRIVYVVAELRGSGAWRLCLERASMIRTVSASLLERSRVNKVLRLGFLGSPSETGFRSIIELPPSVSNATYVAAMKVMSALAIAGLFSDGSTHTVLGIEVVNKGSASAEVIVCVAGTCSKKFVAAHSSSTIRLRLRAETLVAYFASAAPIPMIVEVRKVGSGYVELALRPLNTLDLLARPAIDSDIWTRSGTPIYVDTTLVRDELWCYHTGGEAFRGGFDATFMEYRGSEGGFVQVYGWFGTATEYGIGFMEMLMYIDVESTAFGSSRFEFPRIAITLSGPGVGRGAITPYGCLELVGIYRQSLDTIAEELCPSLASHYTRLPRPEAPPPPVAMILGAQRGAVYALSSQYSFSSALWSMLSFYAEDRLFTNVSRNRVEIVFVSAPLSEPPSTLSTVFLWYAVPKNLTRIHVTTQIVYQGPTDTAYRSSSIGAIVRLAGVCR